MAKAPVGRRPRWVQNHVATSAGRPGRAGPPPAIPRSVWRSVPGAIVRRYVEDHSTCQNEDLMVEVVPRACEPLTLHVAMGRRVAILANLLLRPNATAASAWAVAAFVRVLDEWDGPGTVIVAGNLFDLRHLPCPPDDTATPDTATPDTATPDTATPDTATPGAATPDTATPGAGGAVAAAITGALAAHDRLPEALRRFSAGDGRQVICLPGHADAVLGTCPESRDILQASGVTVASSVALALQSAAGTRTVLVTPDDQMPAIATCTLDDDLSSWPSIRATSHPPASTSTGTVDAGTGTGTVDAGTTTTPKTNGPWAGFLAPDPDADWQAGLDRLPDPADGRRFLTSRLLYRRLARFAWWLLVPYAVVLALSNPAASAFVGHAFHGRVVTHHALARVQEASWITRLAVATVAAVAGLAVLAAILGLIGRKAWVALGGGSLALPWRSAVGEAGDTTAGGSVNDRARDQARALLATGWSGLVTGSTPDVELSHLGDGFFAGTGITGEVVEEHAGRLGLPPVFLVHRQLAWVELETGAQVHARLLLARTDDADATLLERLAAHRSAPAAPHPEVVAAFPQGGSWPPAPDLQHVRRRSRRVRRWASAALAVAGAVDLATAATPPLRDRMHAVLQVLPVGIPQDAGALVALAGIGLLALARGVRRGQHRAWLVSIAILAATVVLHALRGGDLAALVVGLAVLALLVTQRHEFQAASDSPSLRSAVAAVLGGGAVATVVATTVVELSVRIDRDGTRTLPFGRAVEAVVERLAGIRTVPLPPRLDGFISPPLLAVGVALVVVAVVLATRPVVDRALSSGRAAQLRAHDIVRRHGQGTLDYFALRSDKAWFFHHDSLVAYGLYSGICLVSPDPIGPVAERAQVWAAFRRFADTKGWSVSVMGASEQWLPVYRATGMHDIYIGDEAVVDVQRFSLAGGQMKGLRQAYNRIARYGYHARFCDPARMDEAEAARLLGLLDQSRHGERERGFSMMLGRLFDRRDDGLLLCVVDDPDGQPVAMCQFVPAQGIGGYSLDLMRRSRGEHPNGLIDFALISTIEHLRQQNMRGLSLNFAALRSVLDGERGDSLPLRVERWALERMSSFLQIESLWRFNAKYGPDWLPRYVAYDAAEHLVPTILAIVRAESLWEVPVLGRLIAAAERRGRATPVSPQAPDGTPSEPSPEVLAQHHRR